MQNCAECWWRLCVPNYAERWWRLCVFVSAVALFAVVVTFVVAFVFWVVWGSIIVPLPVMGVLIVIAVICQLVLCDALRLA